MATNNNNLNNRRTIAEGMHDNPLLVKFSKFFKGTPANTLRAPEFGRALYMYFHKYFYGDEPIPAELQKEDADFTEATYILFTTGFSDKTVTDDLFVDFMCGYATDPKSDGLVSFDMIKELITSKAFKSYGKDQNSKQKKSNFLKWVCEEKLMKLDKASSLDVAIFEHDIAAIISAFSATHAIDSYLAKINAKFKNKLNDFDETYINQQDPNAFKKLKENNKDKKITDPEKIKKAWSYIVDKDMHEGISAALDGSLVGKTPEERDKIVASYGLELNHTLFAISRREGILKKHDHWSEDSFDEIYTKLAVENRMEAMEAENQKRNPAVVRENKLLHSGMDKRQAWRASHPLLDITTTFGISLGTATVFSAISRIPVVGKKIGWAILGAATVGSVVGLVKDCVKSKKTLVEQGYSKKEANAFAANAGIKGGIKIAKTALLLGLHNWVRPIVAATVAAKTFYDDVESRANALLKEEELKSRIPSKFLGIKDTLKRFRENVKLVKGNGNIWEASLHALGKGAATWIGADLGTSFGSGLSFSNNENGFNIGYNKTVASETFKQTITGKLLSRLNLGGHATTTAATVVETKGEDSTSKQDSEDFKYRKQLSEMDQNDPQFKMTKNALSTANPDNDRQYYLGEQEDLYDMNQYNQMKETLDANGVKNSDAVIRKLYTLVRSEQCGLIKGTEYQDTLHHLSIDGEYREIDAKRLLDGFSRVDETGAFIKSATMTGDAVKHSGSSSNNSSSNFSSSNNGGNFGNGGHSDLGQYPKGGEYGLSKTYFNPENIETTQGQGGDTGNFYPKGEQYDLSGKYFNGSDGKYASFTDPNTGKTTNVPVSSNFPEQENYDLHTNSANNVGSGEFNTTASVQRHLGENYAKHVELQGKLGKQIIYEGNDGVKKYFRQGDQHFTEPMPERTVHYNSNSDTTSGIPDINNNSVASYNKWLGEQRVNSMSSGNSDTVTTSDSVVNTTSESVKIESTNRNTTADYYMNQARTRIRSEKLGNSTGNTVADYNRKLGEEYAKFVNNAGQEGRKLD